MHEHEVSAQAVGGREARRAVGTLVRWLGGSTMLLVPLAVHFQVRRLCEAGAALAARKGPLVGVRADVPLQHGLVREGGRAVLAGEWPAGLATAASALTAEARLLVRAQQRLRREAQPTALAAGIWNTRGVSDRCSKAGQAGPGPRGWVPRPD